MKNKNVWTSSSCRSCIKPIIFKQHLSSVVKGALRPSSEAQNVLSASPCLKYALVLSSNLLSHTFLCQWVSSKEATLNNWNFILSYFFSLSLFIYLSFMPIIISLRLNIYICIFLLPLRLFSLKLMLYFRFALKAPTDSALCFW